MRSARAFGIFAVVGLLLTSPGAAAQQAAGGIAEW